MPLKIHQIRLEVPAVVLAALGEELAAGGITSGFCFLGNATFDPETLSVIWHRHDDLCVTVTVLHPECYTTDWARETARKLVGEWGNRHEEKMELLNRVAALSFEAM